MRIESVFSRILATAMILLAGAATAEAASSVCTRLEGRLASLQRSQGASAGKAASQDNAINQQRAALNAANAEARRAGCKGGFLMFKSTSAAPQCSGILKRINAIQANLNRLEQRRSASAFDPNASARQRSDILQQLALNDCGPQYAAYAQQRPRNFLERLFNPENRVYDTQQVARVPAVAERDPGYSSGETERGFGGGSYRTLCVRTCDGYYFPISFSTRRSNFATDEQVCQQMCPGTNVALYAHRNPGQNSGDARSTTDETPYSALPTAFAYRTSFNPGCTCGSPSSVAAFTGGYSASTLATETALSEPMPPVPGTAPPTGEDPETLANRAGGLDPDSLGTASVETPVANLAPPRQAGVLRRVGPSYFYAAQ